TTARVGRGEFFVVEADESDRSFLMFAPVVAVVTTIDREHLDQYSSLEDIQSAIEGNAIYKLHEGALDVLERGILIEMLAVNRGDHGDDRGKHQEAAVAFVGFHHEIFATSDARSGAGLIDPAANDKCRVEMSGGED